jgi:hypothetical protein
MGTAIEERAGSTSADKGPTVVFDLGRTVAVVTAGTSGAHGSAMQGRGR